MPPRSAPKSKGGITSGKSAQKRKRSSEESRGVTMERKMQELVEAELAAHESTFEAYRAAIDQCSQKIKLYKDAKESWKKKKMSKNATACNKKLQQYSKILEENESDMVKLREAIEATARAQFLEGMANNDNEGAGSDSELESERENSSEESEEEDARPKKKKKTVEVFASDEEDFLANEQLYRVKPPVVLANYLRAVEPGRMPMTKDLAAKKVETKVLTMQKGSGSVKTRALLQSVKNEATKGSALQLGGRAWMPLLIEESDAELLPESDLEVEAEGAEIPKPEALDELHQKSKKAAKKVVKMTKSIVLSRATTVDDSATMVSDTPSLAAENAGPSAGAKAGNPPKASKGYTYIPVIPSEEDDSPLSSPSSPDNRRVTRSRKARH